MTTRLHLKYLFPLVVGSAVVLLLCLFPYSFGYRDERTPVVWFLQHNWQMEQWQHCWIVLPALLLIVWLQRGELSRIPPAGSWAGLPLMGIAALIYMVGYRVDNIYFAYAAIQIFIPAMILWFAGWKMLWKMGFACCFLVFLWPLLFLEQSITFPLRMLMSNAAVGFLQLIGVDVIRNGTGIMSAPDTLLGLPAGRKFAVDVADPCSGIRSLFALMMVSALYAHFTLRTWWQKWILFFCSAPLAILGNLARIVMLTIGTIAFGPEFAIGKNALTEPSWFHMGAGYVVFAVALAGMVGIGTALQRIEKLRLNGWKNLLKSPGDMPETAELAKENPDPQKPKSPFRDDLY